MKKLVLILVIIISFAGISAITKEDGRAGATGSPGETTCNTSQCHSGNPLNNGAGSVVISAPTMPNWQYFPGHNYPISVTVSKTGSPLFGFGFEALRSTGANGGVLSITNPAQTQLKSAPISGNFRTNVVHTLNAGLTADSHTFTFNWTAPAAGTGNVTFYTAGNAANNDGDSTGDFIYTASHVITESLTALNEIPGYDALQLYPNPATDRFKIVFDLDQTSQVEIKMNDLSGKIVENVTSETLSTGRHEIYHDISQDLPRGVYFVTVSAGQKQMVKRVAVL